MMLAVLPENSTVVIQLTDILKQKPDANIIVTGNNNDITTATVKLVLKQLNQQSFAKTKTKLIVDTDLKHEVELMKLANKIALKLILVQSN